MAQKEQHVNVYLRVRPNTEQEKLPIYNALFDIVSPREVVLKNAHAKKYHFDKVFDESSSQHDIYSKIVRPLIPEVIGGYNCTVFAYGQTGAGKTYTMTGGKAESEGIVPRTFNHIFDILGDLNTDSSVRVSYIQLYNEELIDMLSTSEKPIRVFEDKSQKGSVILQGVEEVSVCNKDQACKLLEMGNEKRKTAPTLMNVNSSRSHTVLTIIIHTRETTPAGEELVKTGKINLVDLAGSENISRSGSMDLRAREAANINQSLLTLGRVIKALTEKNAHVPYRESKLTRLLQDSLGGTTKTSLIATVSSSTANCVETLSTLDYAMRARCIKNRPEVNQKISRAALLQQYFDEIERLKKDLQAARTGSGVYLDEENYKLLLEQNETQRNELIGKMTAIRSLQVALEEKNHTLETMQESWTAAANNIETLKREKIEQEQELEEFKTKTKHLESRTSMFYENCETLHNKLSHLYQTSDSNRKVSRVFVNIYSQINNELMDCIDDSILITYNFMDDPSIKSRKEIFEKNYITIKTHLENIKELATEIDFYKANYLINGSSHNSIVERIDDIQLAAEKDHKQLLCDISKTVDEALPLLKNFIETTSTKSKEEIQKILINLRDIRTQSVYALKSVSKELTEFQYALLDHTQRLLEKTEEQNTQLNLNQKYMANVRESIIAHFNEMDKREHLAIAKNNAITNAIKDVKMFVSTTSETLKINITQSIENNENGFEKCDNLLDTLNTNELNNKKYHLEQMEQGCKAIIYETTKNTTDRFNAAATNIADLRDECIEEIKTYDKCLERLIGTSESAIVNAVSATDTLEELYNNEQRQIRYFEEELRRVRVKLDDMANFVKSKSKNMYDSVKNFCSRDLSHPTHAGNTPQRVPLRHSINFEKENVTPNIRNVSNTTEDSGRRMKHRDLFHDQK